MTNRSAGAGRDGKLHDLKTWPVYFREVESGVKTFEVRRDDRDFEAGDELLLREWHPETGYTGRSVRRVVSYVLAEFAGIAPGYVCMALAVPDPLASDTGQEQ